MTATLESIGSIEYDPEEIHDQNLGRWDPSRLLDARAELTDVFEEARQRADSVPWSHWFEHRVTGRPLELLPIEAESDDFDRKMLAKQHIREVDAIVETILDERGLFEPDYQKRAEDEANTGV
ncbi:MAG: hypothetical protein ABEN55_00965 [Bradymonadaceae bacterium]